MSVKLLPRRAGRSRRRDRRAVEALESVAKLRTALKLDREDLMAEIDFLAFRARISGNLTASALLVNVAQAMRQARANEALGALVFTLDQEG